MKLIDKVAVVAEIESILNETNYKPFTDEVLGERKVCRDIKDFIDTIEVKKEVNLEKEIVHYIDEHKSELQGYFDIRRIARHFFVLGINVSNPINNVCCRKSVD